MGINQYERDERAGKLPGDMDTPYTRLEDIVQDYLNDYEMNDGMEVCHKPTDAEAALINDAIQWLICREDFMETIIAARASTHAARKEDGQHPCCGAGLEHPHYPICVNAQSRTQKP